MDAAPGRIASPLWDALGFILSLVIALSLSWQARDLIWSLWLSSLVIGYITIVLGILGAARRGVREGTSVLVSVGQSLFLLAFFSVHFGGFHFVHSVFLALFFPLEPTAPGAFPLSAKMFTTVAASYWPWLISAAIAERSSLVQSWRGDGTAKAGPNGFNPLRPYINVVRMHLLIFFFAASHFCGLGGIWVFCVVFAVYFFPWRLLMSSKEAD